MLQILWVAVFLTVFAASAVAASAAWSASERRRRALLDGRLRRPEVFEENPESPLLKQDATSGIAFYGRLLDKFRFADVLRQHLAQANLKWSVGALGATMLLSGLIAFTVLVQVSYFPAYLLPAAAALAGFLPYSYVLHKRTKRLARFEEQFPEALDFLARAMRAGHALSISMELLSQEVLDPVAPEFRRTFDEHNLGLPLEVVLKNLARRIPLLDVRFFVSAVLLQTRTGGNLSEILLKLSEVIRERFKLKGQVRAFSAHGRLTGKCLIVLPVVVFFLLMLVNPEYMTGLTRFPFGKHLIGGAIILQIIAFLVIRRIVNIRV